MAKAPLRLSGRCSGSSCCTAAAMQHRWLLLLLLMLLAGSSRQLGVGAWGTEISSSVSIFRTMELTDVEYIDGNMATR